MTSIREIVKRLVTREAPEEQIPRDYLFTVHWLTEARSWRRAKRAEVLAALTDLMREPSFAAESLEREYVVEQIDDFQHTGASLTTLRKVLKALDAQQPQEE